jgi:hypothetical protein
LIVSLIELSSPIIARVTITTKLFVVVVAISWPQRAASAPSES